ncbi:MAG: hypothetical protein RR258_03180, partial [Alistipes sp.]
MKTQFTILELVERSQSTLETQCPILELVERSQSTLETQCPILEPVERSQGHGADCFCNLSTSSRIEYFCFALFCFALLCSSDLAKKREEIG